MENNTTTSLDMAVEPTEHIHIQVKKISILASAVAKVVAETMPKMNIKTVAEIETEIMSSHKQSSEQNLEQTLEQTLEQDSEQDSEQNMIKSIRQKILEKAPLCGTLVYLMSAFRIPIPENGLILIDSLGITESIKKFYLGQITFEELMKKYEDLYQKGSLQPMALLSIYLICGWNLIDLLPTTQHDFSIRELKIKTWITGSWANSKRFKDTIFSITRLTTFNNFENDLKTYSQNNHVQERFNKQFILLLENLYSTIEYSLKNYSLKPNNDIMSCMKDVIDLLMDIIKLNCF